MNEIEPRLVAALRARAEQVQPENLGPAVLPTASPQWRLPRPFVVAAGVLVLLFVVPVAALWLGGGGAEDRPGPTDGATHTEPATDPDRERRADINGDGHDDLVRIGSENDPDTDRSLTVAWAAGGSTSWRDTDGQRLRLAEPVDLDPEIGGAEILVEVGSTGAPYLVVLGAVGDGLRPLLTVDHQIRRGRDSAHFRYHWWIESGGVIATRSVDGTSPGADHYPVRMTRWELAGGGFTVTDMAQYCVADTAPEELVDCEGLPDVELPPSGWWDTPEGMPSSWAVEPWGGECEPRKADLTGDGREEQATVCADHDGHDLTITAAGEVVTSVPVPGPNAALGEVLPLPGSGQPVLPVHTFHADGQVTWQLWTLDDGELQQLNVPDRPRLGSEPNGAPEEDARPRWTSWQVPSWQADQGHAGAIYSLEWLDEGTVTDAPEVLVGAEMYRVRVHVWQRVGSRGVEAVELGVACVLHPDAHMYGVYGCPPE